MRYYGLHEVYYDEGGVIEGVTERAEVTGDDETDIADQLKMMLKDITGDAPILNMTQIQKS